MGDSDDDMDYKRRDKFRSERRGYDGGSSPPRREYRDARPGPPSGYRDRRSGGYGGDGGGGGGYRGRDRFSPPRNRRSDMSPPNKRMRGGGEWEDRYDRHDRYDYDRGPPHRGNRGGGGGGGNRGAATEDADGVQPVMMTFKAFLGTQDDSISDEDAVKKYAEYKLEFKRQQLNEFFVTHKDEEWFKLKYHPEDSQKRKDECKSALQKRVEVFMKMFDEGKFTENSIDGDQSDALVKLLDSVVIYLEGGSEFDLQILDQEIQEKIAEEQKKKENAAAAEASGISSKKDESEAKVKEEKEDDSKPAESSSDKRKRSRKDSDASGSSSSDDDDKNDDKKDSTNDEPKETENNDDNEMKEEEAKDKDEEGIKANGESNGNGENGNENGDKKESDEVEEEDKKMEVEEDTEPKPRALHKTTSIFLRNLAPTITKQEVEAMCKKYPGFLRAAIADPQPERRWFRRGWITFGREVKIKEICYALNNIRLRDFELGPIVNRDLSRRVRTINGITVDRKVVRHNIKLAAKVVQNLDQKWGLWQKPQENRDADDAKASSDMGIVSNNPILNNITDYMIEEASAEEEELLGKNEDDVEEGEEGNKVVKDDELTRVLDKLLFYLRIVHSVDFYNHSEYPNEDEMPNRCGIMHARGIPPASNVTINDIDDYCATFEKKMGSFLQPRADLTVEEAGKLGMKNEDDEVEKFVQANTQELGKDKWLCPLSGKKFKGPDFVRKHIFNKHGEKVDEVKKEVQYYNNYLRDPKRPQLPENPKTGSGSGSGKRGRDDSSGGRSGDPYQYSGMPREATNYPIYDDFRESRGYHEPRYNQDRGGYRSGNRGRQDFGGGRGGGRMDNPYAGRPIITYRDLDAPRDYDEF